MKRDVVNQPQHFYRVSLKAVIRDGKNNVLAVQENSDSWSLPGGGLDHGESIDDGLKRELLEEVKVVDSFKYKALGIDTVWMADKKAWLMWVVFELNINEGFDFGCGVDATKVAFVDPYKFEDSLSRSERMLYKWCSYQDDLKSDVKNV